MQAKEAMQRQQLHEQFVPHEFARNMDGGFTASTNTDVPNLAVGCIPSNDSSSSFSPTTPTCTTTAAANVGNVPYLATDNGDPFPAYGYHYTPQSGFNDPFSESIYATAPAHAHGQVGYMNEGGRDGGGYQRRKKKGKKGSRTGGGQGKHVYGQGHGHGLGRGYAQGQGSDQDRSNGQDHGHGHGKDDGQGSGGFGDGWMW